MLEPDITERSNEGLAQQQDGPVPSFSDVPTTNPHETSDASEDLLVDGQSFTVNVNLPASKRMIVSA